MNLSTWKDQNSAQLRAARLDAGRIWQVYPDADRDNVLFEGSSKTACIRYIKTIGRWRDWKKGVLRYGQVIWEAHP